MCFGPVGWASTRAGRFRPPPASIFAGGYRRSYDLRASSSSRSRRSFASLDGHLRGAAPTWTSGSTRPYLALASLLRANAAPCFSRSAAFCCADIGDLAADASSTRASAEALTDSMSVWPSTPVLLWTRAGDGSSSTRLAFSAMDAFRVSICAAADSSAVRRATSAASASGSSSAALESATRSPPALSSKEARYASPSTPRSSNVSPSSKAGGGVKPPGGPGDTGVVIGVDAGGVGFSGDRRSVEANDR